MKIFRLVIVHTEFDNYSCPFYMEDHAGTYRSRERAAKAMADWAHDNACSVDISSGIVIGYRGRDNYRFVINEEELIA